MKTEAVNNDPDSYDNCVRHMDPELIAVIQKEDCNLTTAEKLLIAGSVKLTRARELFLSTRAEPMYIPV